MKQRRRCLLRGRYSWVFTITRQGALRFQDLERDGEDCTGFPVALLSNEEWDFKATGTLVQQVVMVSQMSVAPLCGLGPGRRKT